MDVSDLIEAIDALDNKFLEEAEQDLSIEEIAKLQEEFVSSLDKENAACPTMIYPRRLANLSLS